jgi:hypothetical protein
MQEIEEVRCRRTQPFDVFLVELPDGVQDVVLGLAAGAQVQEAPERDLVVAVLVDVGDAQLGLPEEGVVGALEDLALLRDRADDGLQQGALVDVAEAIRLDSLDDLFDPPPDGAEVLEALFPEKPRAVGCPRVGAPALDETPERFGGQGKPPVMPRGCNRGRPSVGLRSPAVSPWVQGGQGSTMDGWGRAL